MAESRYDLKFARVGKYGNARNSLCSQFIMFSKILSFQIIIKGGTNCISLKTFFFKQEVGIDRATAEWVLRLAISLDIFI